MARILIVEDEEILAKMLAEVIEANGHTAMVAEDGAAGIAAALDDPPDLIVTDMSLPKVTGWDLVRRLRDQAQTRSVPIVALSGHDTSADRDAAFDAGVTAYHEKPVDVARLTARIDELLAQG